MCFGFEHLNMLCYISLMTKQCGGEAGKETKSVRKTDWERVSWNGYKHSDRLLCWRGDMLRCHVCILSQKIEATFLHTYGPWLMNRLCRYPLLDNYFS